MREIDFEMTNFDGSIDDGFAEALQEHPGDVFGSHYGLNFCGKVYFSDGLFHEEVWVYGCPREVISAKSLQELMTDVCNEYGYE